MDTTLSAPIGQLLDGRYLVESQLARGGMATVYLSRDIRLDRTVALKIAHPELAREREFVARFISEARSAARLSSPHVVAVYDQGSTGDLHYIAMEYVPGPTLRELLVARGRLSPREALDIMERVLAGLAAAHDANIIHRDVKPENVLLGTGTSVKVADFGLARAVAGIRQTKTGLLIGTAAYLAPEQVSSSTSDTRTDVYAAGVMLFEMLTGVQPHTGDTPLAVAYKHVNSVVPAPSSLNPDLPAALDALVAIGTSRDPDLRPPDARHYLKAITEVRRGMPLPEMPRLGQHAAAPALPRQESRYDDPDESAPGDGPVSVATASTRQIPADGYPGPGYGMAGYGASPGQASANHTMVVPVGGMDEDYASGYRGRRVRRARYSEPFLQRWLFSRRILIVLGVLVAASLAWWLVQGQYTTVPRVVSQTVATARTELANAGFKVVSGTARHDNAVPAGHVIATDPAGGTRASHGGRVVLITSLGPALVTMPSVTGQQLAQAEQNLHAAGLTPGTVTHETSSSIPAGVVISTSPAAYQHWPQYKAVQLVVSAGPPLPSFVGQQVAVAQGTASAGGYSIQQEAVTSSDQPAGTVVKQSPQAGTPITPGEVVTVWVSPGPAMVNVPDVQGENEQQAISDLKQAGFNVTVNDSGLGSDVTSYSPTGQAPQGSTITINVGISL
ncbi:MAG TPA: Stk1 family PASTA domain-containing Ser/Thr kinase [Streptosporangiaceae bacterium]|jgi:serine/threonine-protein kinase